MGHGSATAVSLVSVMSAYKCAWYANNAGVHACAETLERKKMTVRPTPIKRQTAQQRKRGIKIFG